MAAVLRLWESAIEVLHGLPHSRLQGTSSGRRSQAGTSTGHVASVADALYRIQCAHEGRVLPEATWKKMIRDKVPCRLAAACLKVLSNRQLAVTVPPGPKEQSIGMTHGQYAIQLLLKLVSQAGDDGVLGNIDGPYKIGVSLGQQLQQSGFLEILPQVLTDAADSLHATAATGAALRGEPDQHGDAAQSGDRRHGQAGSGSATGSTSTAANAGVSSSSREACGFSTASRHSNSIATQQVHSVAMFSQIDAAAAVLDLPMCMSSCWPEHAFVRQVAPACSAPIVHLAVEVLQHVSRHFSSTTADSEPSSLDTADINCVQAWQAASHVAGLVLNGLATHSLAEEEDPATSTVSTAGLLPHLKALVHSPHLLPCLCLTMVNSAYSTLLLQLPALPTASTQSGQYCSSSRTTTESTPGLPESDGNSSSYRGKKGTSKSSGGNRQSNNAALSGIDPTQAWQFACSQHKLLPESHDKLLHLLGSSSRVLLCLAAAGTSHAVQNFSRGSPEEVCSQMRLQATC